jgi:ribosomal protein S18 acetylase RimI-like enzyme
MRVEADPWLAGVFGHDAFRVSLPEGGADADAVVAHLRDRGSADAFYYAKVPTARVDQTRALANAGLHVVDVNVTFECPPDGPDVAAPGVRVRDAHPEDSADLLAIASSCFVYSRFHLDPHVPAGIADAVKRAWVDSYLHSRRGERLLVVEAEGRPAGFLAVLAAPGHGRLARVIDLVGVDKSCQGRGLGKALVSTFLRSCRESGTLARVGTQAANIPSMRLYERCGFHIAATAYVLHAHVKEGRLLR